MVYAEAAWNVVILYYAKIIFGRQCIVADARGIVNNDSNIVNDALHFSQLCSIYHSN